MGSSSRCVCPFRRQVHRHAVEHHFKNLIVVMPRFASKRASLRIDSDTRQGSLGECLWPSHAGSQPCPGAVFLWVLVSVRQAVASWATGPCTSSALPPLALAYASASSAQRAECQQVSRPRKFFRLPLIQLDYHFAQEFPWMHPLE